jgi:hypothetical protein
MTKGEQELMAYLFLKMLAYNEDRKKEPVKA